MAKWKCTLKTGNALRQAIDSEDIEKVLDALKDCYLELNNAMPDWFDEGDLEDKIADIDNEFDNLENYEDYDMTYDDVEENVDYLLETFYDICDDLKVWVGM